MNKKGLFNTVEYIVYISFILITSVFILIIGYSYLNETIDTTHLEIFILTKKLVYSDSCLALKDEYIIQSGVIDLDKLNSNNLINCFTKPGFGYLIKVKSFDGKVIKSAANLDSRQEAYFPVCKTISKYKCLSRTDLVLYSDKNEIKTGYIEVEVINLVR